MVIDIVSLLTWVTFGVLGFRDASARKLVAIAAIMVAMFLGQWLMHDVGTIFRDKLHVQPSSAPKDAFTYIFFFIFLVQSILYRFLTGNYKFGGIIDRFIGVPLGLVEGAIVISVVIFIFRMDGPPSKRMIWDSRLYRPTASIAPRIMDVYSSVVTSAGESLRELTVPGTRELDSLRKKDAERLTPSGAAKGDSVLNTPR
jgi:uncharacterized membrane protein required for colicin V production